QRAVLILRDVMGWKAQEVADLLDLTVTAVNSALQRARATLKKTQDSHPFQVANHNEKIAALLSHYVQAWEAGDSTQLINLLRDDAILTMPPIPAWYQGRAAVLAFLEQHIFKTSSAFRLVATRANGAPAFAVYMCDGNGDYRPSAIHVLTIRDNQI